MKDHEAKAARKVGPWESILILTVCLAVILGFIAAIIGLVKWA